MILLVVGLVAVIVVVFIAVILSIRLGHGDDHDEPDMPSRGRDRRRADEDERWPEDDARPAPSAAARGLDPRGRRGGNPDADRGAAHDRDLAALGPARADATGYRKPAAARSPVPATAQARGRYDTGPQRRPPAGGFPAAGHPSMDFGVPGDQPSVGFPAAGYGAIDHPEDRPERRRKAASANGNSRSRQRGKRNDDDDWPSTEWDKLSDEQYWAELSADKPLAAMAKPSRPASRSGEKAPVNGSARRAAEPPAAHAPRRARTPAPVPPAREVPGRMERTEPREAVTERLPVRSLQQSPAPAGRREAGAPLAGSGAPGPRPARDTGPHGRPDPLRDSGPWARHDTGPQPIRDTGPRPEQPSRSTPPNPARDRDLAMRAGRASTPPPVPGALDDDPLTSPSFSVKADTAADSRSYGGSRKHAKPGGQGAAPGNGAARADGNGNGTGSYPTAEYAGAGYAYQSAPPAAPAEQWHSAPPAPAKGRHTAAYGNPYQHAGPSTGHGGYVADPPGGYPAPAHEVPGYAGPASPARQAPPDPGMTTPPGLVPYANGHAQHSYPGQAAQPDGHSAGGYTNGYEPGYGGDPYAGGRHGPYPPRG